MKLIPLSRGLHAQVSDRDFKWLTEGWKWQAWKRVPTNRPGGTMKLSKDYEKLKADFERSSPTPEVPVKGNPREDIQDSSLGNNRGNLP